MKNLSFDISQLGRRELNDLQSLLKSYQGKNKTKFIWEPKEIGYNFNSGRFFFVDENNNCAMEDKNDVLRDFITCPECGNEGFEDELLDGETCCLDHVMDLNKSIE